MASLLAAVRGAVTTAFDKLTDVVSTASLVRFTGGTYSATTGPTDTTTSESVRVIVLAYKAVERQADPEIGPEDVKVVIEGVALTTPPHEGDQLVVGAQRYEIADAGEPLIDGQLVYTVRARPLRATS